MIVGVGVKLPMIRVGGRILLRMIQIAKAERRDSPKRETFTPFHLLAQVRAGDLRFGDLFDAPVLE